MQLSEKYAIIILAVFGSIIRSWLYMKRKTSSILLRVAIAAGFVASVAPVYAEDSGISFIENTTPATILENDGNNREKNSAYFTSINTEANFMAEDNTTNSVIISLNKVFDRSGQIVNSQVTNAIASYFNNTADTVTIDNIKYIPNENTTDSVAEQVTKSTALSENGVITSNDANSVITGNSDISGNVIIRSTDDEVADTNDKWIATLTSLPRNDMSEDNDDTRHAEFVSASQNPYNFSNDSIHGVMTSYAPSLSSAPELPATELLNSAEPPAPTTDETYKYIHGEITPSDKTFTMTADDNLTKSLGTMEVDELIIDGGETTKYSINGNNKAGITVGAGQTLTIQNAILNGFKSGEATFRSAGTVNLINIVAKNNSTSSAHGGFFSDYNYGTVTGITNITDSLFENNTAATLGGVIDNQGKLTVTNSRFNYNTANTSGGAVSNDSNPTGGNMTFIDTSFTGNIAKSQGGAIYNLVMLNITNGVFTNNTASSNGGAIYTTGTTTITDSDFINNTASSNGGAIYNTNSNTKIIAQNKDVLFTGNKAGSNPNDIYTSSALALNAYKDRTMRFDDGISGGTLNINNGDDYLGTILFNAGVNSTVNFYNGKLSLGSDEKAAPSITTLKMYGGTLDIQNGVIDSNVIVNTINNEIGLEFDIDLEHSTADKLTGNYAQGSKINLLSVKGIGELAESSARIQIASKGIITDEVIFFVGEQGYVVQSSVVSDNGYVTVGKGSEGLYNAAITPSDTPVTYTLAENEYVLKKMTALAPDELTVQNEENIYDIRMIGGMAIASGKTLNLKDIGVISSLKTEELFNNSGTINISQREGLTTVINGKITGTSGIININEESSSTGEVAFNNDITGNTINLYNGKLLIWGKKSGAIETETLNIYGGNLSILNNVTETITFGTVSSDLNIEMDVDLKNNISDYITGGLTPGAKVNILALELINPDVSKGTVKLSDVDLDVTTGFIDSPDGIHKFSLVKHTDDGTYLDIVRVLKNGLEQAVHTPSDEPVTYTLIENEQLLNNLDSLVAAELTIDGTSANHYGINASGVGGLFISSGQTLTLKNLGKIDNAGTITSSINGFSSTGSGGFVYSNGIVNISDSVISNNHSDAWGGAICNDNELNIDALYSNVLFTGNTTAGEIPNDIHNHYGTININAADGRTVQIDGGITGTNGAININQAEGKTGKFVVNGNISGQNEVNLYNGTLNLGINADSSSVSIESLNIYGGTLDTRNGIIDSVINLKSVEGDLNIILDLDLENSLGDVITSGMIDGQKLNIKELNFLNDTYQGTAKISELNLAVNEGEITSSDGLNKYFINKVDIGSTGTYINVLYSGLYSALHRTLSTPQTYTLATNETLVCDLGTMETNNLTIDGGETTKYEIIANEFGGITQPYNKGLTIKNVGDISGFTDSFVKNNGSSLTVQNSKLSHNSGTDGGAISAKDAPEPDYSYATLSVSGSTFYENTATANGGAIDFYSEYGYSTISNSTFTNNTATANGGAIDFYLEYGYLAISNSTFTNNTAANGGAIDLYLEYGYLAISNSTFTNNSADEYGGAIMATSAAYTSSYCDITDSNFTGNYSENGRGGAIYTTLDYLTIFAQNKDVLFSGNYDSVGSNAIFIANGSVYLWADNSHKIVFDDALSGNPSGTNLYIDDGNVTFNNDVTGIENVWLSGYYYGTTLNIGKKADGTPIKLDNLRISDMSTTTVNMLNDVIDTIAIKSPYGVYVDNLHLSVDVDLDTKTSDSLNFSAASDAYGYDMEPFINDINLIGTADLDVDSFTFKPATNLTAYGSFYKKLLDSPVEGSDYKYLITGDLEWGSPGFTVEKYIDSGFREKFLQGADVVETFDMTQNEKLALDIGTMTTGDLTVNGTDERYSIDGLHTEKAIKISKDSHLTLNNTEVKRFGYTVVDENIGEGMFNNEGTLNINDTKISDSSTKSPLITNNNILNIDKSTFQNNYIAEGFVHNDAGTTTITDTKFENIDFAYGSEGYILSNDTGIFNMSDTDFSGTGYASSFYGNFSGTILNNTGDMNLHNTKIKDIRLDWSSDTSQTSTAGIYNNAGNLTIEDGSIENLYMYAYTSAYQSISNRDQFLAGTAVNKGVMNIAGTEIRYNISEGYMYGYASTGVNISNVHEKYTGGIYNTNVLNIDGADFTDNFAYSYAYFNKVGTKSDYTLDAAGAIINDSSGVANITDTSFINNSVEKNTTTYYTSDSLAGAIINHGIMNISANAKDVVFDENHIGASENDIYNTGTLGLNARSTAHDLTFYGIIRGNYAGTININQDASNTGTVVFNNDVYSNNVNLYNGTLKLGAGFIEDLNIYGGTLSIANGSVNDNISIYSVAAGKKLNLIFDVDFADISSGISKSDKIYINGSNNNVKINDINILNDLDGSETKIMLTDDCSTITTERAVIFNGKHKYVLAASEAGLIDVNHVLTNGIYDAVHAGETEVTYKLSEDETVTEDLYASENGILNINGNNHKLSGNNKSGINIDYVDKTLNIKDINIDGFNHTYQGGTFRNAGNINIDNSSVTNNSADRFGGFLYNMQAGTAVISNSIFENNSTSSDPTFGGGAINNDGTLTVNNSVFTSNNSSIGGAYSSDEEDLSAAGTFNGTVFTTNTATMRGGAINNVEGNSVIILDYGSGTGLTHSEFNENVATDGGAIFNTGDATVTNAIFTGNIASNNGGAINNEGTLSVDGAMFTGNKSTNTEANTGGGAIYNKGIATISNSIFASNEASNCGGAIYNSSGGTLTVTDSIFLNNSARDAITNGSIEGTNLTINATNGDTIFEGSTIAIYNNNIANLNASSGHSIILNGGIYTDVSTPVININNDDDKTGTVIFNADVTGQSEVKLYKGTLKLGSSANEMKEMYLTLNDKGLMDMPETFTAVAAPSVSNLKVLGGTLDLMNGIVDEVQIKEIENTPAIAIDINFEEGTNDIIKGEFDRNKAFSISSANIPQELASATTRIKISDAGVTTISSIIDSQIKDSKYKYLFKASAPDDEGYIDIIKGLKNGLHEAISDETSSYTLTENEQILQDLPELQSEITINGTDTKYEIFGNGFAGLNVQDGTTVTINNVGNISGFKPDTNNAQISNTGTLNIVNSTISAPETENTIYNSGILNVNSSVGAESVINGKIAGDDNGTININQNSDNTGTVIFNDTISNQQAVNLYNGVLQLGSEGVTSIAAPEVSNLNLLGGTLSMMNGSIDTVSISSIDNEPDIAIDIDFENSLNDKISGDFDKTKAINIGNINLIKDLDGLTGEIQLSDVGITTNTTFVNSNIPDSNYQYKFEASTADDGGVVKVMRGLIHGLYESLHKGTDTETCILPENDTIIRDLGTIETADLTVDANLNNIEGQNFSGVTVGENKKLTIKNASEISGFKSENGGFANIEANGELNIINSTVKDNIAENNGGAFYIAENGTINIVANAGATNISGNKTSADEPVAIYNEGTVNMTARSSADVVSVDDKISGTNGIININNDSVDGTTPIPNTGTVLLNNTVTNNTVNLYNGTLQLGKNASNAPAVSNLNIKGDALLSMANNVIDKDVAISSIDDTLTLNLALDIDFEDTDADGISASDSISITDEMEHVSTRIDNINLISELDDKGKVKISDKAVNTNKQIFYTGDFKYDFEASDTGVIDVIKGLSNGLEEAVHDGNDDVTYLVETDENVVNTLGNLADKKLTIKGNNNHSLKGNNYGGITVDENRELIIQNVGQLDADGNVVNAITGFSKTDEYGGFINNILGTVTIENSVIADNSLKSVSAYAFGGAIYNETGTLNIINSIFKGNNVTGADLTYSGAIYNLVETVNITNSTFIGNFVSGNDAYSGAIYNGGELNITDSEFKDNYVAGTTTALGGAIFNANFSRLNINAEGKDVLFEGNKANSDSNAIYNASGTINLNADTNKKIIFNDAIDGEYNDYDKNEININNKADKTGTIVFNEKVLNQNSVNLINGTLQLGSKAEPTIAGSKDIAAPEVSNLNIKGGTLDIANNLTNDNVKIKSIESGKELKLVVDIDFANIDAEEISASDKVTIDGTNKDIRITDFNILSDLATSMGKIKISNDNVHNYEQTFYKDSKKYVFHESVNGIVDINTALVNGLYEAVHDGGDDVTYILSNDDTMAQNLGISEDKMLTIIGDGNYNITGENFEGMTIDADKEVIIENIGSLDDEGNVKTSVNTFSSVNGGFINNKGQLKTNYSVFSNNKAENGGAIANSGIATIENTIFTENKASKVGAAISNSGTMTLSNTTFANNTATENGGAIYNNTGAVLTLAGKNIFENNTVSGDKNDIHNEGTVNVIGETSFDGGMTGNGTLNITEHSSADFATGKLEQGKIVLSNTSDLNIDNETEENLTDITIQDGGIAHVSIDFDDKLDSFTSANGTISISSIDLSKVTGDKSNVLTTTLGNNIQIDENTKLLNQNDINYFGVKKDEMTLFTEASSKTNLNTTISKSYNNCASIYELKTDEKIDTGSTVKGNPNSKFIVQGNGNSITDGSVIVEPAVNYINIDTNYKNSKTAGSDSTKAAITLQPNSTANIVAENHDIAIINTDNHTAVYLESDGTNYSNLNLVATNGKKIKINDDIVSDNKANTVNFNGNIEFNGIFDPATANVSAGTLTRNGYDDDITYNLNSNGTLHYINDKYLYNADLHNGFTYNLNTINFNGGNLDLRNFGVNTINLAHLNLNANSNIYLDADLRNKTMDNFGSTKTSIKNDAKLHVDGFNILSDAKLQSVSINFTKDKNLQKAVDYTGKDSVAYSPLYKYDVTYDKETGNFNFDNKDYELNPAITTSEIATQMAFLNQLNTYDEAFANMDMTMLMPRFQRIATKMRNKYAQTLEGSAGVTYTQSILPEDRKGIWFKPFATIERVPLSNGPAVGNNSYGALVGGDTQLIELKNGWDAVYSFYAGYNGSNQHHEGNSINQNGGLAGGTAVFYKGNFFTGLTANVGASQAEASTTQGTDNFTMLTTGIASKTGYNFEFFNGKFIAQPNWLMSYTMINAFNYKNAQDIDINSEPLHAIQVTPGLKLIGNLSNGWQPYASVQMVWNILDKTKFTAEDVSLPEMSVNPYVQYGIGIQKTFGDRLTGSLQATFRNGGRNGVSFATNFRYALGDAPLKKINMASKDVEKQTSKQINIQATRNQTYPLI